jgi:hypothetical protein
MEGGVLSRKRFFVALFLVLFLPGFGRVQSDTFADRQQGIMAIVEDFKVRLEIQDPIRVEIVPEEKRLVSVRRCPEVRDYFLIRFDENFLALLDEEELRAAVAHELGHIWIFTRRPYLHTESLANRQALLLVSADSLERLYLRVAEFNETLPGLANTEEAEHRTTPVQDRGLQ